MALKYKRYWNLVDLDVVHTPLESYYISKVYFFCVSGMLKNEESSSAIFISAITSILINYMDLQMFL